MANGKKLKWKRKNTLKKAVPNKPGWYKFYGRKGGLLYVGHAKRLRHRVQSYRQDDCFKEHPTKRVLRKKIHSYSYKTMPESKARRLEKRYKKDAKFNYW